MSHLAARTSRGESAVQSTRSLCRRRRTAAAGSRGICRRHTPAPPAPRRPSLVSPQSGNYPSACLYTGDCLLKERGYISSDYMYVTEVPPSTQP